MLMNLNSKTFFGYHLELDLFLGREISRVTKMQMVETFQPLFYFTFFPSV